MNTSNSMTMITNTSLPFELNPAGLSRWLESLSSLPHAQAGHQLNEALKQLKLEKCEPSTLLPLLINLVALTLHLANHLSSGVSTETDLSDKAIKMAKMSMQLTRRLALLFCRLAESKTTESLIQASSIYYALQLIGYSMRSNSLCYEIPSATLWKKSAALFQLAVANDCLLPNQTTKVAEFKTQSSVLSVIKRNLLFSILQPSLYKASDIQPLFQLANQMADQLIITTDREPHCVGFYWDLGKDLPPYPVKKFTRTLPDGFMAIDSQPISNAMALGTVSTLLNPSTQNKLAVVLGSYQPLFNAISPGPPSSGKLISGFVKIGNYLLEVNRLAKIHQLSTQLPNSSDPLKNLSLVPLEHQRNVFDVADRSFGKQQNVTIAVNLLKTPNSRYWVAESRTLNCSTGDIVLMIREQHPASLAIVRQQRINDLSNAAQFLLELMPGTCSLYNLDNSSGYVIVISDSGGSAQAFLPCGKYSLHSTLHLGSGISLQLKAHLEQNHFFERFHVQLNH